MKYIVCREYTGSAGYSLTGYAITAQKPATYITTSGTSQNDLLYNPEWQEDFKWEFISGKDHAQRFSFSQACKFVARMNAQVEETRHVYHGAFKYYMLPVEG